MAKTKKFQFGALPPMYTFMLNPYSDQRISRCPVCEQKTGQRKVPLSIHVDPGYPIALNYTCRYCRHCDLLIAHKLEIEHLLTRLFRQYAPQAIGNAYLIIGTLEKKAWREGQKNPKGMSEMRAYMHDFKEYYQELRMTRPGWYAEGQEPPIMEPPPSEEWVTSQ
jgi:hypothetical protein